LGAMEREAHYLERAVVGNGVLKCWYS